jgi:hypothetical protein
MQWFPNMSVKILAQHDQNAMRSQLPYIKRGLTPKETTRQKNFLPGFIIYLCVTYLCVKM